MEIVGLRWKGIKDSARYLSGERTKNGKAREIPEGFRFHDLRHTTASWRKMGGADDYTVMEILGHSDIKMMKRYAHLDQAHKRKGLAMLPGWTIGNPGTKVAQIRK